MCTLVCVYVYYIRTSSMNLIVYFFMCVWNFKVFKLNSKRNFENDTIPSNLELSRTKIDWTLNRADINCLPNFTDYTAHFDCVYSQLGIKCFDMFPKTGLYWLTTWRREKKDRMYWICALLLFTPLCCTCRKKRRNNRII